MKKGIYQINAKGTKKAEVLIYENIGEGWFGGLSAKRFAEDVKALGPLDELKVRINSDGGNVFDGIAIYNTLVKTGARIIVDIDGLAASIASIVAMAGDEIRIAHNGYMMIHDPWSVIGGTADDFRQMADTMDKIRDTLLQTYCKREGADEETLSSMMSAETWLTAQEALEQGLVDTVSEPVAMAALASCELKNFKNVPDALAKALKEPEGNVERNLTRRAKLAAMGQAARKSRS